MDTVSLSSRSLVAANRSVRLPDLESHQTRQHLVAEIRQLVEVVYKRQRDPAHAGFAKVCEFLVTRPGVPMSG
jgi:hypothetical protein